MGVEPTHVPMYFRYTIRTIKPNGGPQATNSAFAVDGEPAARPAIMKG